MIGFGTYLINTDEAKTCVLNAIRIGYRHIDTAEGYGNETGVGHALKNSQKELGISREDLFVTTKLWPGNEAWGQTLKTYDSTIESLNSSLSNLELDYVDLYLIHAPFAKSKRLEQWNALVELRKQGKAKAIGVSNFSKSHIEEIKSAGLPLPDANQIELHPWSQKSELVSYLRENRISPIAYSSLVPLAEWCVVEGQDSSKTEKMKSDGASNGSPFKAMAKKYGVTEAQVLLRWGVQKGYPVLPKSTNEERVQQNMNLFSFEIDHGDMSAIEDMDRGDGIAWASGDPCMVP
jgi:2,5-diketo-D-gluconate reductase A